MQRAYQVALVVKNPHDDAGDKKAWVQLLGQEDPLRRAWQPTLVVLTGESPWTEKPGGLQSIESQRGGHD